MTEYRGMRECLGPEIWISLLDELLPQREEAAARTHIELCARCRAVSWELMGVEQLLRDRAGEVRDGFCVSAGETQLALRNLRERLNSAHGIAPYVDALQHFLSGMLGERAGDRVLRSAAGRREITEAAWPGFILRLTRVVAELCGESAGTVVA